MKDISKNIKNKIENKILLIWVFALLIMVTPVLAETALLIEFDPENSITQIIAVEDNIYYGELFTASPDRDFLAENDLMVQLYDKSRLIGEFESYSEFFSLIPMPLDKIRSVNRITVSDDDINIAKTISFCNNNNICEYDIAQGLAENVLVCTDCKSNAADGYCDEIRDGICDPDCVAEYDCDDCEKECLYEKPEKTCADERGNVCKPDETCTGEYIYTADAGYSCCKGDCMIRSAVIQKEFDKQVDEGFYQAGVAAEGQEIAMPETAKNLLLYLGIFVAIGSVIVLIFYFRKRAGEKESTKLQDEINDLLKQRYNYPQIKLILTRRGYSTYAADKEIKRNYDLWRARNKK